MKYMRVWIRQQYIIYLSVRLDIFTYFGPSISGHSETKVLRYEFFNICHTMKVHQALNFSTSLSFMCLETLLFKNIVITSAVRMRNLQYLYWQRLPFYSTGQRDHSVCHHNNATSCAKRNFKLSSQPYLPLPMANTVNRKNCLGVCPRPRWSYYCEQHAEVADFDQGKYLLRYYSQGINVLPVP